MSHGLHSLALRYFYEVANAGSISVASERLHVAVSAISRQIAKLESEVGTPLFERQVRGMVLSDAGEVLLAFARRSLLEAEQAMHDALSVVSAGANHIRLACSEGFATDFLPRLIDGFRREHPRSHFQLAVTSPGDATQQVRQGESDLALTFSLTAQTGVNIEYAERAPIYALVHHNHPLASRSKATLEELCAGEIVLSETGTTIRTLVDIAAGLEGLALEPVFTSNNSRSLYRYAQLSGAVLFSSLMSVHEQYRDDGFVAVRLDGNVPPRRVEVQTMVGRTLPPHIRAFADFLIRELKRGRGGTRI